MIRIDIEIKYVGVHYSRPERINYSYFLEGYDTEWSDETKTRIARYTNLPTGEYIFKVKAQNADGYWNENPIELAITIHPPFWNTWWAYFIYAILFVSGLSTLRQIELNRRKKKEEQKLLEAENKRKGEELEEKLASFSFQCFQKKFLNCKILILLFI
ncbi:MAG: triple tyrosine motif-containing protein [Melioribacteraceae bacterium]|nr:triple tyrosine motif-containing protein [Melioribacteraceae bacterium]